MEEEQAPGLASMSHCSMHCRPTCNAPSPTLRFQVIEAALADAGMEKQQIDWLVMHQANMRIMSSAADRLGVPPGALRRA